jgi:hypothetical protein
LANVIPWNVRFFTRLAFDAPATAMMVSTTGASTSAVAMFSPARG